ncbi:N-acetylneuraminate synthase family protein [Prochlorococcus marinus]|uniref:N-acetylneuraminate synthase family protein n=1 Tax=Prochlorococcus marinus TaxID=1219 RepID=UPI001ADA960B|nr:N-acetylneuraminate synthase family protein [Prochlorococcus marinus]MBO8217685.1 hypothetical protein [Prochlorococcus marinus XMU1405]MBW3040848.1 hypothetical protein [Prochlorococcus marinus str. MU1405]MBW3048307.1 hypothetical protein [Prochlorococcus marinus str. MU1406]
MDSIRVIPEIAQAHDGSLGMAYSYVKALKDAGAKEIKFQMHFADEESTKKDRFRKNIFPQDIDRYSYWKRIEFSNKEWAELINYCRQLKINPIVSPFSYKAIDLCEKLDIKTLKIGSGELNNEPLLIYASQRCDEIVLSTGMSTWNEIDKSIKILKKNIDNIYVLQCTSKYPTNLSEIGIENIVTIVNRYGVKSGLSDHSGKLSPSLAAAACESTSMLETHVIFNKSCFGPDASSSILISEFAMLKNFVEEIQLITNSKVDKSFVSPEINNMKNLFGRSMVASVDILKGTKIEKNMIKYKKPGGGLTFADEDKIIGKLSKRDILFDELINEDDFK